MIEQLYQTIDWQAPWYQNLITYALGKTNNNSNVKNWLNEALNQQPPILNFQKQPIKFVAQEDLPSDTAYEVFIAETGKVPTRDNFHDLLGGLIWLNYPILKATFNCLHYQDIQANGINTTRSSLRNALTVFDENGGMVVSTDLTLLKSLQNFDWTAALYNKEENWLSGQTQFFPVGHALLEKLITPRKAITSHVLLILVDSAFFAQSKPIQRQQLDNFISEQFLTIAQTSTLMPKIFQPLPVMGVPDFCAAQSKSFYDDKSVFRDNQQQRCSPILRFK